jgi:tetratricopeptide (TPR) repeat protein
VALVTLGLRLWNDRAGPLGEAEALYQAGDYKKASTFARDRLGQVPDDVDALRLYARSLVRQGRDSSASAIYNGRLGTDKMQAEDFFLLGLILERAGNLELAFNVWSKAAKDFPNHAELLDHLTRLCFQLQRLDVAQENAERLSKIPGFETKSEFWRGVIQATLGDLRGATGLLEQALNRDPKATEGAFPEYQYRRQLAQALLLLGKPEKAIEQLKFIEAEATSRSEKFDPHSAWLLSRAYLQESKLDEAREALVAAGSFRREHPNFPDPSPYLGEGRCAKCHRDISDSHQKTRHARTFHWDKDLLKLPRPDHPLKDPDEPSVSQSLVVDGPKLEAETRIDDKIYRAVVKYAFGTPNRYFSLVMKDEDGIYRVFRLSYFSEDGKTGWGRSSGDAGNDDRIQKVRGQMIHVQDTIVRCVACHVTNARNFAESTDPKDRGPETSDHGIGCERCHGPGGNHERAMNAVSGFADTAIASPPSMPVEASTKLCAECHVVGSRVEIEKVPDSEQWVRSPGLTMTFSRCYTESQGAMSCLTCHDPHRDAEKSASFYEAKCLKCHTSTSASPGNPTAADRGAGHGAPCPVNPKSDCLGCHMPKVRVPVLHTSLTDHFIRVRDKKED